MDIFKEMTEEELLEFMFGFRVKPEDVIYEDVYVEGEEDDS